MVVLGVLPASIHLRNEISLPATFEIRLSRRLLSPVKWPAISGRKPVCPDCLDRLLGHPHKRGNEKCQTRTGGLGSARFLVYQIPAPGASRIRSIFSTRKLLLAPRSSGIVEMTVTEKESTRILSVEGHCWATKAKLKQNSCYCRFPFGQGMPGCSGALAQAQRTTVGLFRNQKFEEAGMGSSNDYLVYYLLAFSSLH